MLKKRKITEKQKIKYALARIESNQALIVFTTYAFSVAVIGVIEHWAYILFGFIIFVFGILFSTQMKKTYKKEIFGEE